jgi:hypothetical protein
MHDERKKSARNKHVRTISAAHRAGAAETGARQDARVAAGFAAAVVPQIAARRYNSPWLREFVPMSRRPARSPVLGQDYGRRPHRCLQSGRITSRRP